MHVDSDGILSLHLALATYKGQSPEPERSPWGWSARGPPSASYLTLSAGAVQDRKALSTGAGFYNHAFREGAIPINKSIYILNEQKG